MNTPDTAESMPTVVSTTPADLATGAVPDGTIRATFSEDMDPGTINSTSFVVVGGLAPIAGEVTYDPSSRVATFEPEARLSLLGRYTATITTAATNLGGAAVKSDHRWSFTVRDGVWAAPVLIETDNAGNAMEPQVAVDAIGNAVAVWHQYDPSNGSIWANRFVPGTGWGTATLLENDNGPGTADSADVAANAAGDVVAVWQQGDGTRYNAWANRFVPGTGWGVATLLESENGNASNACIGLDADGNAVAVWSQWPSTGGDRDNIWARGYVPGSGWGTGTLIETGDAGPGENADVAVDAAGNAVAVWYQSDGTRDNIWVNHFVAGTGWGIATQIESNDLGNARNPQVAVDAGGNAVAVWYQSDGTRYSIWANQFATGSGWGTAALIEDNDVGDAFSARLAMDTNGGAIVVWYQSDGTRDNVWANRFIPGNGWGAAELIETDNVGGVFGATVTVDAHGNAVAVWSQSDGTRNNVWANRFVSGSGWGTAGLVETDNAGSAHSTQIAVDASGNVIAVWSQSDGIRNNVWAATFR